MLNILTITFQATLAILIVILIGAFMRRVQWLTPAADKPLTDLTMNVLYPAATFMSIRGNENLANPLFVLEVVFIGWISIAVGMVVSRLYVRFFSPLTGLESDTQKRTFVMCNCLFNYGFLPIPLCALLFNSQTLGVLFVFNVGTVIGMWTIAVAALSKDAVKESIRQLCAPAMIGVYIALLFNYLPWSNQLPECIETSMTWLNQSMIPLSLLLVGGIMYDEFKPRDAGIEAQTALTLSVWNSFKLIGSTILIRLVLVPILFILWAKYLAVNVDLQRILIVQAAMPSAIMCLVWSRQFNGDPPTALRCVIVTNLLSILTTLFWIPLGLQFLGN
ncbi:MAG: AEC family transporter [Thermoguttaceae bacterium]|nr:AEC family transporter [Thermoguttaceae bacterium]